MDRTWMYAERRDTWEFINGVEKFCATASDYRKRTGGERIYCPCFECCNVNLFSSIDLIREHFFRFGFKPLYYLWIWHGEEGEYLGNSIVKLAHEHENNEVHVNDDECEFDKDDNFVDGECEFDKDDDFVDGDDNEVDIVRRCTSVEDIEQVFKTPRVEPFTSHEIDVVRDKFALFMLDNCL